MFYFILQVSQNVNCNEEQTNNYKNKIKLLENEIETFKVLKILNLIAIS